jgi:hypothetical protein
VRHALGERVLGAYLVGSFALGDADGFSDVDFVVVTNGRLDADAVERLQPLHERIRAQDVTWAHHLEGSYIPEASLRRPVPGERYPYLDNGASRLVWDDHCNTVVVRWTLREHGIVLAGPDPKTLVSPVSPDDLREEARRRIPEYAAWAREVSPMRRWMQGYLVVTLCRLLHTLATGSVATKTQATEWALRALDPEWAELIAAARDDRPNRWARADEPVAPEAAARTVAFADYAVCACS